MGESGNLGDANGDNIKKFDVKWFKDSVSMSKIFRADSPQIAQFETKTPGFEWRHNLQVLDEIDVLDAYGKWETVTVVRKDNPDSEMTPQIYIGFRRYSPDGD